MASARSAAVPWLVMPAVAAAALAWAVGAMFAVDPGADSPTTYAAALPAARVADVATGLGLLLAGGLAWTRPRTRRLGLLVLLAGIAWFGPDWEGAADGPAILRTLGAMVAPVLLVLALHVALALPDGRVRSRTARAALAPAYAITAAVSIGGALFRDPLLDLYCWRNCRDNAFLVRPDPGLAGALGDIWRWTALAIAVGVVAVSGYRLLTASRPARRTLAPLLGPLALVGLAETAYAVALLHTPLEDPGRSGFAVIMLARSLAYAALALGLAWSLVRIPLTRARVGRVAGELGAAPPPGRLRDTLATALGDPGLEVVYPRAGSGQLIDVDGRPVAPPAPGRAVVRITGRGRALALVVHDAALVDEPELERALGSAARLAVENEALRAEALAQVHELRASRARIVELGDAERRRLERNLHDGAQQRLLALSYDLRLVRAGAAGAGEESLAATLDEAGGETGRALDELRDLAHGIYPAILTEAGLAPALATLADQAPLPVELSEVEAARQPLAVETTAHVVVADAIADAHRRGASVLAARVVREGDRLVITAEDDGAPRIARLVHLADRVGALGGTLDVGRTTLRAEIPCA
jgi:signal transduction histidine kinase